MVTRKYRKHTEEEIESLKRNQRWFQFKILDFILGTFITAILCAGGGWYVGKGLDYLLGWFIHSFESPLLAPSLMVIGLIYTIVLVIGMERDRKVSLEKSQRSSEEALQDGRVEVIECKVNEAAELEEFEDEGPGFFLQVKPNLLLFLQGQEFMVNDFPRNNLVLTRDARTHTIFDLQHDGVLVKPTRTIQSNQFGGTDWLCFGMFIHGNVNDLPGEIKDLPEQEDMLDEFLKETGNSERDA